MNMLNMLKKITKRQEMVGDAIATVPVQDLL